MARLRRFSACLAALLACFLCAVGTSARAASAIPPSPKPSYIYDGAGWLDAGQFAALNSQLEAFERETSSQIVVAVFPKVPDGEELFDFCQHVFVAWKPGLKGKDNGAILFIFAAERRVRIHPGFGMEGVLPDARCKQITDDIMHPLLAKGDRAGAIASGAQAMMAASKGEYKGTGSTRLDGFNFAGHKLLWILGALVVLALAIRFPWFFLNLAVDIIFSGGGSSSGGGGSSGGFSGGGGDSGGGGASGSW